jgi:hypothetical protein
MCEILRKDHAALCAMHLAAMQYGSVIRAHSLDTMMLAAGTRMTSGAKTLEVHQARHAHVDGWVR